MKINLFSILGGIGACEFDAKSNEALRDVAELSHNVYNRLYNTVITTLQSQVLRRLEKFKILLHLVSRMKNHRAPISTDSVCMSVLFTTSDVCFIYTKSVIWLCILIFL